MTTPMPTPPSRKPTLPTPRLSQALEVFLAFLKLGLTSFGGPVAHLGYFRTEFVERRRWLDDNSYSDLVALCQFLPGPASSQVGIALGLGRAGWLGALAAWTAFTLPSALLLILFALGVTQWSVIAHSGVIHGLKIAAVAIVAQAVWGMAKSLCPDRTRVGLALGATLLVLLLPSAQAHVLAIVLGGLLGHLLLKLDTPSTGHAFDFPVSRRTGALLLGLFTLLLLVLPWLAATTTSIWVNGLATFYQAGALVFGGGHVVLPLLQASVVPPGWVSNDVFLAGYGAAQAVPGPLFTFAAYLGAAMHSPFGGWAAGLIMLLAIFLPAWLLVVGTLPFWELLRRQRRIRHAMAGINAAVVGILLAALYDPVWTSAIHSRHDFALALAAFGLLVYTKRSPVIVVALCALAGGVFEMN